MAYTSFAATSRILSRSSPPSLIKVRLAFSTFWRRSVGFLMAGKSWISHLTLSSNNINT